MKKNKQKSILLSLSLDLLFLVLFDQVIYVLSLGWMVAEMVSKARQGTFDHGCLQCLILCRSSCGRWLDMFANVKAGIE